MRRRTLLSLMGGSLGAVAVQAQTRSADAPPATMMRLLVGVPPGGTTDLIARMVAPLLAEQLKQTVIVENRPGVSGLLAAEAVAKSPPDGSLLLMAPSQLSTYRALYPNTTLQPEQDLAAIGLMATTPYVLAVHPSLPVNSFAELIAYAKANPGKLSCAGSTPGSVQHLTWELIKRQTGTDMLYVPYKGTGALMPDLLAGRLQAGIDNVAVLTQYIKGGQLRGIAVTSATRATMLPELPTIAASASGIADFQALGWFGVYAAANTSPTVLSALREATVKVMANPDTRAKLAGLGAEPQTGRDDAMRALLRRDTSTWTQVIQDSRITVQ